MYKISVHALRYTAVLLLASIIFYLVMPEIGKYILGFGLVSFSVSTVMYIIFMFKRYGEKETV